MLMPFKILLGLAYFHPYPHMILMAKCMMTVCHCITLVVESDQNKWKMTQNEKEKPKNEEKISKCEDCGLCENLSEKGAK